MQLQPTSTDAHWCPNHFFQSSQRRTQGDGCLSCPLSDDKKCTAPRPRWDYGPWPRLWTFIPHIKFRGYAPELYCLCKHLLRCKKFILYAVTITTQSLGHKVTTKRFSPISSGSTILSSRLWFFSLQKRKLNVWYFYRCCVMHCIYHCASLNYNNVLAVASITRSILTMPLLIMGVHYWKMIHNTHCIMGILGN